MLGNIVSACLHRHESRLQFALAWMCWYVLPLLRTAISIHIISLLNYETLADDFLSGQIYICQCMYMHAGVELSSRLVSANFLVACIGIHTVSSSLSVVVVGELPQTPVVDPQKRLSCRW